MGLPFSCKSFRHRLCGHRRVVRSNCQSRECWSAPGAASVGDRRAVGCQHAYRRLRRGARVRQPVFISNRPGKSGDPKTGLATGSKTVFTGSVHAASSFELSHGHRAATSARVALFQRTRRTNAALYPQLPLVRWPFFAQALQRSAVQAFQRSAVNRPFPGRRGRPRPARRCGEPSRAYRAPPASSSA